MSLGAAPSNPSNVCCNVGLRLLDHGPTLGQTLIEQRLLKIRVCIIEKRTLQKISLEDIEIKHGMSGQVRRLLCASVVLVKSRV